MANDTFSAFLELSSLSTSAYAIPSCGILSPLSAQKAPAPPPGQPLVTCTTCSAAAIQSLIPDCQGTDQEDLVLRILITLET